MLPTPHNSSSISSVTPSITTPHDVRALFIPFICEQRACFSSLFHVIAEAESSNSRSLLLNQFLIQAHCRGHFEPKKKTNDDAHPRHSAFLSIFFGEDLKQHFICIHISTVRCNKCAAHAFNYSDHIVVPTTVDIKLIFFLKMKLNVHKRCTHL